MNKEAIINELEKIHVNIVNELREKAEMSHSMVDIDEDDTIDPEDFSHQYESGEMEQLIRVQMNKAKSALERVQNIDFSAKSDVQPGALVKTDHQTFIIGQATMPFDAEGIRVIGISPASPIYTCMMGKKAGDKFSYSGTEYEIQSII